MFSLKTVLKTIPKEISKFIRNKSSNTVFALSTGFGKCGVAVIRVSGPEAGNALTQLTNLKNLPEPRKVYLKNIKHPLSHDVIDKGFILWFPGPKSFTGEDSCEFHIHGGIAVINGLLDALSTLPNLNLATPGEFTKRAFLNGKLDLTEVEGLADLLQAETEAQRKQAFLQSTGSLSKIYHQWREILTRSVANVEAFIDFEETETIEFNLIEKVAEDIRILSEELRKHLADGRKGEMLRRGVRTVIIGEPNVGKSSLLNLLCQRPASIVTPISGTTRDIIEVTLNIKGYPMILVDTAGLRHSSEDIIEIEGISRAKEMYRKADLVMLVIDFASYSSWKSKHEKSNFDDYIQAYTKELAIPDLIPRSNKLENHKECMIVLNKIDLDQNNDLDNSGIDEQILKLSCKSEEGITDLVDTLGVHLKLLCGEPSEEHPSMNQIRHKNEIQRCLKNLEIFLNESKCDNNNNNKVSGDVVIMAERLRNALRNLGKLIGTVSTEDILEVIFRDFCIGK